MGRSICVGRAQVRRIGRRENGRGRLHDSPSFQQRAVRPQTYKSGKRQERGA
jgi:hypothetical protein